MTEVTQKTDSFLKETVFVSLLVFLASLSFSTALMEISFGAAFGAWLLLRIRHPAPLPFERRMFLFLSAFVFLSVVSIFWSEFPRQSLRGVFKVLKQFFIFWIAAESLQGGRRNRLAFRVLAGIFIFLGLDGMWQYVFGKDLLRQIPFEVPSTGPRVSASLHNFGLLSAFLVSFWPLLVSGLRREEKPSVSFQTGLGIVFGLLLLFWTRQRGAWIAFGIGLTFFLVLEKKKSFLFLLVLAAAIGFLCLPRSNVIHQDKEGRDQSLLERFYLWDRALEVIEARPWTGTGINTYAVAHQKYDQRKSWRVRNYYAHNGYLQIAAETGLPALISFLAFLFFYFRNGFRFLAGDSGGIEKRFLIGILVGTLNFLILGAIDTIFHNPQPVMGFWFLAGWGIALTSSKPARVT